MRWFSIIIGIIFILSSVRGSAQDIKSLNSKLDSLQESMKNLQSKIKNLTQEEKQTINQIKLYQKRKAKFINGKTYKIIKAPVVAVGAILRDTPQGSELTKVMGGDTVLIYAIDRNLYFEVTYKNVSGYISYSNIERTPEVDAMIKEEERKWIEMIEKNDPKYARLMNIYGKEYAIKIINKELWKGMSHGMVVESLGRPFDTSKQNTDWGMREIWLYDDKDLIFLNGELTSWRIKNK